MYNSSDCELILSLWSQILEANKLCENSLKTFKMIIALKKNLRYLSCISEVVHSNGIISLHGIPVNKIWNYHDHKKRNYDAEYCKKFAIDFCFAEDGLVCKGSDDCNVSIVSH